MMATGMFVPESLPAGTSMNPVTACPGTAVAVPTVSPDCCAVAAAHKAPLRRINVNRLCMLASLSPQSITPSIETGAVLAKAIRFELGRFRAIDPSDLLPFPSGFAGETVCFDLDYCREIREAVRRVSEAMDSAKPTISTLIDLAERGDEASAGKLFTLLYEELHRLARRQLARQGQVSLSATTLIHEAYLDMAAQEGQSFPDRGHFMAYAARVMRGLIIDHVRNRLAIKRGGRFELTSLTTDVGEAISDDQELTQISHALDELARVDCSLSQIVDLKFFCGFSFAEIGDLVGVSERTVQRKWEKARIYLHRSLRADLPL
jgi:RNA polymerase sigma factor (TIGR02999 family)